MPTHPALTRLLESSALGCSGEPGFPFRYALGRLLDGLAELIDERRGGAGG
ncbi:hypothetical protein [Streptomyces sp. ISL-94]|uniref:hypothetical protein n=1 Tax=Streptomyces sp. ISL-94 TaxID=2819190 RepID=UPI001BEC0E39|nr:hypothetical protein [Streptomyces sp. ISL-94]MBT2476701.1 hypothetical protein [Streptomyces sp. ISL-94]